MFSQAVCFADRRQLFSKILPRSISNSVHRFSPRIRHVFPGFLNLHAAFMLASQNRQIGHNPLYDSSLGNHKDAH